MVINILIKCDIISVGPVLIFFYKEEKNMFISISIDLVSQDSSSRFISLMNQYGIKKIQANLFESFDFPSNKLGNLKREITDCLDSFDKLRMYQFRDAMSDITPTDLPNDAALVLFSGGQDSTTCLAWALARFGRVETIGFDYGQRHRVELAQRAVLRARFAGAVADWARTARRRSHHGHLGARKIGDTALTQETRSPWGHTACPTPSCPGAILFLPSPPPWLTGAASHLVGGMCETDFSGYPDCRDDTFARQQIALTLGMDRAFDDPDPADVARQGRDLAPGRGAWRRRRWALIVEETHTCYLGSGIVGHS